MKTIFWLRSRESSLHSVTAGNGAIYAVRTTNYVHVADIYCHDLEIPHLMVQKRKRAVYEPTTVATRKR